MSNVFRHGLPLSPQEDRARGRWGAWALGWLRQEENQYLSCPPSIARDLDPTLQALLGYAMGSYALGYYTPPLPPGVGPEIAPPQVALGADAAGWGEDLRAAINEREKAKADSLS